MLCAGVDISGNQTVGNQKFISFILGTDEHINAMVKRIGPIHKHMNHIYNKKHHGRILSELKFDGQNCIGICALVDQNPIINEIQRSRVLKKTDNNMSTMKIKRAYNFILYRSVKDHFLNFAQKHKTALYDVVF